MAPTGGIRIEGLRDTIRSLEKFGVEASDLKAAFHKIGNMVVSEASTLVPRKSGKLANSIRASKTKNKSLIRAGSASVPYAGVIHYGWPARNIEAQPFLIEAASNKQNQAVSTMEEELNSLIRRLDLDN